MRQWDATVLLHDQAVDAYAAAAEAVREWTAAPKPGKWSPGQITAHLNLAFEAILCEARGGPQMKLRTKKWQRVLMRFTIQRRLMKGGAFPHGAPAPRETRPPEAIVDQMKGIAEFRRLWQEARDELNALRITNPRQRFLHPYFGSMPMVDGLYISARHIDHHRSQITGR